MYWMNLVFALSWIAGWVYLSRLYLTHPSSFAARNKDLLRKNWINLAAVGGMVLAPFIWINFHQDNGFYDYKRALEKFQEDGDSGELLSFHEYAIYKYPDNIRVNIDYLIYAQNNGLHSRLEDRAIFFQEQIQRGNHADRFQLLSHLGALYTGKKVFTYSHGQEFGAEEMGLYHFLNAEKEYRDGNAEVAQDLFIEVLDDKELEDLAYARLESIWKYYYTWEELSDYAYDMKIFPHMSFSLRRQIYIKDRAWGWYLFNALYRDFFSADLPAYLAVAFSLFVWMLFIVRMLFVKNDKWKYIIPLFFIGTIFPILVYILSDLLRFAYTSGGIDPYEHYLLYCVVNIGMVEELVKIIPWVIFYFLFKEQFHRPVHFMLLPIVSALGFAFQENLIYVNTNDYELVFVRSGISLIMHVSCSAIVGYMAWRANLSRSTKNKILYLGGGFLLASFMHGLFDYVIFTNRGYLDIIVLLISLHLFILFVNNAINFSGIKHKNSIRQLKQAGVVLLVGMIAIFSMQYLIIGWTFSPSSANHMLKKNIIFALVTTIYLVVTFSRVKLRPRVLYKFSFADVFGQFLTTNKGHYMDEVDYKDCEFRLFAPKSNNFVGAQLPLRAKAIRRTVLQGDLRWWLVEFEEPLYVSTTDRKFALIKAKDKDEDLFMDKVEIILLMIPDYEAFKIREKHHSKEFFYTGRVYSRPIFVPMDKNH